MCGIAGIRRLDGGPVDVGALNAMAATLRHRGPDGGGTWISPSKSTGFAHRRLAIIDPEGSPQPLSSVDGRHHVCFNGEIFNYRDVRRRLDYAFRTNGDTEALLAAFAAKGAACLTELIGQFAFAIHDHRGDVWLVRDRLGVLPLYYYQDDEAFIFASEVKAILAVLQRRPQVDLASLHDYLTRRAVRAPFTLFDGIRKVPPGHWLRVRPDGHTRIEPYWTPPGPDEVVAANDVEALALVDEALSTAVDRSLVADVPVGAYLSGGVDSSLICALIAQRNGGETLRTYSAGFGDPRIDELPHAAEVSRWLGTRHTEVHLRPEDFALHWEQLTWHRDAPVSEPADVAVWSLARAARQDVKVVLSGEGSDELFGGYPKHRLAWLTRHAQWAPGATRRAAFAALDHVLPPEQRRLRVAGRALAAESYSERLEGWFSPFSTAERAALLGDVPRRPIPPLPIPDGADPLQAMLYMDTFGGWLSDNLLERGDRMSMAASLELRPPFLDHELVELAFRLPSSVRRRGKTGKWVIKELARRHLPPGIVDRRKSGFRVPLDAWFRDSLRDLAADRLLASDAFVPSVMDRAVLTSLLGGHASGRRNEDIRIWTLLCLEIWHDAFFRSAALEVPADAVPGM